MAQRLVIPGWLNNEDQTGPRSIGRGVFLDKAHDRIMGVGKWFFEFETVTTPAEGWVRSLAPAARLGGVLLLITGAALSRGYEGLLIIFVFTMLLVIMARVSFYRLLKRCLPLFLFTFIVAAPVFLDLSLGAAGDEAVRGWSGLIHLNLTTEGLLRGGFFLSRSTLMLSLVVVLGLTTTPMELLGGLKKFPLPPLFTTMLFICMAGIFRLLGVLEEVISARKARTISRSKIREMEGWFAGTVSSLLERTRRTSEEVAMAMASRGFNGRLRVLKTEPLKGRDFFCIGLSAFVSFMAIFL